MGFTVDPEELTRASHALFWARTDTDGWWFEQQVHTVPHRLRDDRAEALATGLARKLYTALGENSGAVYGLMSGLVDASKAYQHADRRAGDAPVPGYPPNTPR